MHWTQNGADGILTLRACILSGRYEDFRARSHGCLRPPDSQLACCNRPEVGDRRNLQPDPGPTAGP